MTKLYPVIGLVLVALALLLLGGQVRTSQLWSSAGNLTVPWLCSATAFALLVVAGMSALTQKPPSACSRRTKWCVTLGFSLVLLIGILVDGYTSPLARIDEPNLAEWLGFTVILSAMMRLTGHTASSEHEHRIY
jgi:hypothetical protein